MYQIRKLKSIDKAVIELPSSKSIANRLLIAQSLATKKFEIKHLSKAEDTKILKEALKEKKEEVNVGMAGTAYRFLTAYYSITPGIRTLTGAERMLERPIHILVEILQQLGAEISYCEKKGFPPLKIKGQQLKGNTIRVDGSVSSQYISALLLIVPYLGSLELHLTNRIVSLPYIDMTINLMNRLGITIKRNKHIIEVQKGDYFTNESIKVEKDWSSAAFFYQLVSLAKLEIKIPELSLTSVQGDVSCAEIFSRLGVDTEERAGSLHLKPAQIENTEEVTFDLTNTPDLIPSVAVTVSSLIQKTTIKGVSTLRIKECDRVNALKNELSKLGASLEEIEEDSIVILKRKGGAKVPVFETYNDHRMAMCLAPLALVYDSIQIDSLEVVKKSFPNFWKELEKVGLHTARFKNI